MGVGVDFCRPRPFASGLAASADVFSTQASPLSAMERVCSHNDAATLQSSQACALRSQDQDHPAFLLHSVAESAAPKPTSESMVDITKPRHDQSTFQGRLAHFYSVTSPLTLLSGKKELQAAREHVQRTEAKFPRRDSGKEGYVVSKAEADKYWRAKQLVQSSVHPDTGDVVPLPFRMSAFVPTNLLVVGGMLRPTNGMPAIIFWQWVNQSLNVAVNYSNANKSVPMDMKEVMTAYTGATASAVALAVGLTRVVTPGTVLARLVPFASVASAGCVNVSLMRWKEIRDGVSVFRRSSDGDGDGERVKVGDSAVAGRRAVGMTAASRVMTNIPTMIFPPLAIAYMQRKKLLPKTGRWAQAADLALIGASLFVALPPAIAYFPQTATIDAQSLEPRFHDVRDEQGRPVTQFEFNKGL